MSDAKDRRPEEKFNQEHTPFLLRLGGSGQGGDVRESPIELILRVPDVLQ